MNISIKAISPDQPGTTAAARFVFQETGRAQDRQTYQAGRQQGQVDMATLLAAALIKEVETQTVEAQWHELEKPNEENNKT